MVLEELANGRLIVECHTANEYAQIDEALKSFGGCDFSCISDVDDNEAACHPYYYVNHEVPSYAATLAEALSRIPGSHITFPEFMAAMYGEESDGGTELNVVSLEEVS